MVLNLPEKLALQKKIRALGKNVTVRGENMTGLPVRLNSKKIY